MTTAHCVWPQITVTDWSEFQRHIASLDAHWPNSHRCLFRGQSQDDWSLVPSLTRELKDTSLNAFQIARLERELANQFRQEAHRALPTAVLSVHDYLLDWWPLMRHHGAPTRLLDWSLSPYVGVYFAVEKDWDFDGALWWFRATAAENLMVRRLHAGYKELWDKVFGGHDDTVFFSDRGPILFEFELKRTIDRIGNQQGRFTVCMDPHADHAEVLEELTTFGDGPHCQKLIIPREQKPLFLRELQLMNITGKSMFPGLDGLGRTLSELAKLSIAFGI